MEISITDEEKLQSRHSDNHVVSTQSFVPKDHVQRQGHDEASEEHRRRLVDSVARCG